MSNKVNRFTEIATEVTQLIGFGTLSDVFNYHGQENGVVKLDERLQEILNTVENFTIGELTAYLRYSYSSSNELSNWRPLLTATRKIAEVRGHDSSVFHGLDKIYKSSSYLGL